jgi:hypothetical protein
MPGDCDHVEHLLRYGESHHRCDWRLSSSASAMEVVRGIIEERTATRNYRHRLMDYNNDPTTHLRDVQSVFKEALERMKKVEPSRLSGE